jgi:predicted nucleotidyltransferase
MPAKVSLDKDNIADFCRKNHIRRLSLFGSVLGDNFGPDSDLDVLVEFHPDHVPGLIRLARLERELSEMLGYEADVRTAGDLSRYFRDAVLAQAEVQYEE